MTFQKKRRQFLRTGLCCFWAGLGALSVPKVLAQPSQTIEKDSVFITGSAYYHTKEFTLPGPEGHAAYKVSVAWPKGDVPEGGFASVYALDGVAVAGILSEPLLKVLAEAGGPAIVALGHDVNKRFASIERTYDYTPPNAEQQPVADPMGRAGGHAPEYYRLLVNTLIPKVEKIAPLNAQQRTLWGHSYGGLFALWSAFFGTDAFNRVVAASPALWWNSGEFLSQLNTQLNTEVTPNVQLDVHYGSAEREESSKHKKRSDNAAVNNMIRVRESVPASAYTEFLQHLRTVGVTGENLVFDGLSHGATFSRSFELVVKGNNE